MNLVKYYFRNYAPMWLYSLGRKLRHLPQRLEKQLNLRKPELTHPTLAEISFRDLRFKIQLDPKNGLVDKKIFKDGVWEPKVAAAIYSALRPGDTFFDIGANVGFFTLFAAAKVGPGGMVHAFEPLQKLNEQLGASVEANGFRNVSLHRVACGDSTGLAQINVFAHNIGKSSLYDEKINDAKIETVELVRLDDYLELAVPVNLMKIDVEGYEYEVLKGAQKTIAKYKPTIIMEFAVNRLANITGDDATAYAILEFLKQKGYSIKTISGDVVEEFPRFINRQHELGSYVELLCECLR